MSADSAATASQPLPEFAALDFESARLADGSGDVPVQIGIACTRAGHIAPAGFFCSDLRQTAACECGGRAPVRHPGANAPGLLELWPEIRDRLRGKIIVAHGAGTEKRFLHAFPGHGFGPWVDTLRLSRAIYPELPSHALADICVNTGIVADIETLGLPGTWHHALYDAAAALVLLRHLLDVAGLKDAGPELWQRPALDAYFRARTRGMQASTGRPA